MEGVRRWMGTHPITSPQKTHGKPISRVEVKKVCVEHESNLHSTEAIAWQLLDPTVSEEEEEEYQGYACYISANVKCGLSEIICRYIDQCQELTEASVERKDLAVYLTAVRIATGEADGIADDTYLAYVQRGTSRYLDVTTRTDALPVTFNYERWINGLGQRT